MNWVLNLAVVAAATLIIANSKADAAVVNITEGSTSGYTMTDGNTYVIQNSVSFSNSTVGGSGMTVANNATVVIYVPTNVTLTAIGANGSGRTGGGAGIRVPETATLIITGEGTVNATGGNAGNGADGAYGSNGRYMYKPYPGEGGNGGNGGGGAGAGIGGIGGAGGWASGGDGYNGETMGCVYVIGSIDVVAFKGAGGNRGDYGGLGSGDTGTIAQGQYCHVSGGSGGGGGGAGSPPTHAIGGGGSSGGAGGRGSTGISMTDNSAGGSSSYIYAVNTLPDGGGGGSLTKSGKGGSASSGGAAGAEGESGTLYVSPAAAINVERTKQSATTHSATQYIISFDANGGLLSSSENSVVATLGSELPDCITAPKMDKYSFAGWATAPDGITMWYGSDGGKLINAYTITGNTTLYAVWMPVVATPEFTPDSGTIFDSSLSVSISCSTEGAVIHYTTDGSDPTIESPVYRRFRVNGKTIVKAVAEKEGMALSEVVTAEYALGQCADPVITPNDGTTFEWAGEQVSINWQGEDGVLRYTTDGNDPTPESLVYDGPFTINDTTVVKAKAFGDQFFDSAIVTANITRVWTDVAVPQIQAAKSFSGSKTKVMISCATEGATIYYTKDGSEPNSHSMKYAGPFYVTDSCMIKAYAGRYDYRDSAVATHSIEKVWGIGDTLGKPDHGFTTDGSDGAGWVKVDDTTAPNGEAMKSGVITHSQSSVLSTTVMGPGTLTFSWRTSCVDSGGQYDWDHAEFVVDGAVLLKRDGISSWAEETVRINGDGEHTVAWTYTKDDVEKDGDDAVYVAGYSWASDYTETKTTAVPIPYAWLLQNDSEIVDEFDAYEAAANATAANGFNKVWECYVAGISPTNETAKFAAKIEMKDGAPVVTWEPNLNTNGIVRIYKVYGSETLENGGDWQYPTNSLHKFFKVTVEMP